MTPGFWRGRRVFLTGHTGFKGAWLSLWLAELGAKVSGYALLPYTDPNFFTLAGIAKRMHANTIADIRDLERLRNAVHAADPEIIIHMAAQPLVRQSYKDPVGTYAVNVMGSVNLLESARDLPGLRAMVVVTTDKCYENREWVWGYRENDRLGGRDPYSNSKACAELVTQAFRQSFFKKGPGVATARAGNVIGGGDWSDDRLVPDIVRGCFGASGEVKLRDPDAVRPWQHVLDPLSGYLLLAERLMSGKTGYDEEWNFGPANGEGRTVGEVAAAIVGAIGTGRIVAISQDSAPHEAGLLTLDCAKARARLGWKPRLDFVESVTFTAAWYAAWRAGQDMERFSCEQIRKFSALGAK